MDSSVYLSHYYRCLWEKHNLVFVLGNSKEIGEGRAAYNARYKISGAGVSADAQLERLFAAAGLAAVSLADRESWGWSLTLPGQSNGFFCGVEPEGMICGNVRAAPSDNGVVVVQRQKGKEPLKDSHYNLKGSNPAVAVERYFEKVDQIATKIAVSLDGRCVLVQSLPGGEMDVIESWSKDELVDRAFQMRDDEELKHLEEVLVFYECRCDDEMILNMLTSLPADKRGELWGNLSSLEIECPRCGREYKINRSSKS